MGRWTRDVPHPQLLAVWLLLLAIANVAFCVVVSSGVSSTVHLPRQVVQCSSKDGDCAACLKTNDTRPDWASPCIFLSGKVEAGHTCAPSKWWYPPYNSAAKYPTVHPCSSCSDCKPSPPPPPPPPCLMHHRPNCWPGTWHDAPKVVPSPKSVDGPLLGNGDVGVVLGVNDRGNLTLTYYVSKNDFWFFQNDNIPGRPDSAASYIMGIGGVDIVFPAGTQLVQLTQNISAGSITAVVSLSSGPNITAQTFLSLDGQLITTLSSSEGVGGHKIVSTTWTFGGSGPTTGTSGYDATGSVAWATRRTNSTVRPVEAALATTVVTLPTSTAKSPTTTLSRDATAARPTVAPPVQLTVTAATPMTIATAVVSSIDAGSISRTLPTALNNAKATHGDNKLRSLQLKVEQWWSNYWNASSITLPTEPHLEEFWFKSLYVLGACSRQGKMAPGLWGSWLTTDSPAWHGDCKQALLLCLVRTMT